MVQFSGTTITCLSTNFPWGSTEVFPRRKALSLSASGFTSSNAVSQESSFGRYLTSPTTLLYQNCLTRFLYDAVLCGFTI